ncbi:MAG: hypothetical protein HC843_01320 [Sphingomonadales bacterium]|nr:hypothetical protein [Sphingomonadales bacterium]
MMSGFKFLITMTVLQVTLWSGSLYAKDNSEDQNFPFKLSDTEARLVLHDFASCSVDGNKSVARQLALMHPLDPLLHDTANKLTDRECLETRYIAKTRLKFMPVSLRYTIAEALIHKEMKQYFPAKFDGVPALDHGEAPKINTESLPVEPEKKKAALLGFEWEFQNWVIDSLGECAVRQAVPQSRQLVDTRPGSKAEKEALVVMEGYFAKCRPQGLALTMNEFDMRGAVAVNYYRLALASFNPDTDIADKTKKQAMIGAKE